VARGGHPRRARLHEPRLSDLEGALRAIAARTGDLGEARPTAAYRVLPLAADDLETLNRRLPVWNSHEYRRRLLAQDREELVEAIAWFGEVPAGRGMVLFPEHEEFSTSAVREGCAEIRDVFVSRPRRRLGVAKALMETLEDAVRDRGMARAGLSVSLDEDAAPARALYERLGYVYAHGPFVSSTDLLHDEGPVAVGAVMTYLVKEL
jgi:GNAT superfamily N-acetyltransferase